MRHSYMVKVLRVGEPMPALLVNAPNVARRYWNSVIKTQPWFDEGKEHLVVLLLSARLGIDGYSLVSIGSLSESMAHPREIFRAAVAFGAYAIVIMHNHPSGDPRPSIMDQSLTKRLVEAAEILQIRVLDHVIVGRRRLKALTSVSARTTRKAREAEAIFRQGYYSFKEAGAI
jgi:DNA repair protein RadC